MTVTKKILTEKGLRLTLSDSTKEIEHIYIDKASNYKNTKSINSADHNIMPIYEQTDDIILIQAPADTPTFFTISLFYYENKEDKEYTCMVIMFINEFSLFKAKVKYLQVFDGDCVLCSNVDNCSPCNDKRKRSTTMSYMMRLNLFHQCYKNNNIKGSIKYYIDACRMYDMDKIPFLNINLDPDYYKISGNLFTLYNTMNEWIKNNGTPCEKRVIESLLLGDLYSLIFGMGSTNGSPEWILEDHVWNMDSEFWFGDGVWKF